jgi:hypothetical protein
MLARWNAAKALAAPAYGDVVCRGVFAQVGIEGLGMGGIGPVGFDLSERAGGGAPAAGAIACRKGIDNETLRATGKQTRRELLDARIAQARADGYLGM